MDEYSVVIDRTSLARRYDHPTKEQLRISPADLTLTEEQYLDLLRNEVMRCLGVPADDLGRLEQMPPSRQEMRRRHV